MVHVDASMLQVSRRRWFALGAHSVCCVVSFAQLCTLSPVQNISMERFQVSQGRVNAAALLFLLLSFPVLALALKILTSRRGLMLCVCASSLARRHCRSPQSLANSLTFSLKPLTISLTLT